MRAFKQQRRTLALAAVITVGAVLGLGCGGGDNGGVGNTTGPGESLVYAGQTYRTIKVNGKRWMAENLNYAPQKGGSWCYEVNNSNCGRYGRLYDWETAKTVCPAGWHLPTRREWGDLAIAAGGAGEYGESGMAGNKLKSASGWNNGGNGTDGLEFTALAGGCRNTNRDGSGMFFGAGTGGFWWTDTEHDLDRAYFRQINLDRDEVEDGFSNKTNGFSVRCREDG